MWTLHSNHIQFILLDSTNSKLIFGELHERTHMLFYGIITIYQYAYVCHGILEYAMVLTVSDFFSILLYFDISVKNIKFKSFSFPQKNSQLTK